MKSLAHAISARVVPPERDEEPVSQASIRRQTDAERFAHFRGLSSRRDSVSYQLREAERLLEQAADQVDALKRQLAALEAELEASR